VGGRTGLVRSRHLRNEWIEFEVGIPALLGLWVGKGRGERKEGSSN